MCTRKTGRKHRVTSSKLLQGRLFRGIAIAIITIIASIPAFAEWSGNTYAPYVDTCLWPNPDLTEGSAVGVENYVLAFIVAKSATDATPTWGGYSAYDMTHMKAQIDALRERGGDVMVSLGGEANTPLAAAAKTTDELTGIYEQIIDAYELTQIDFDIEGGWVNDTASIERRSEALAKMQTEEKYQDVDVWYTLPVNPTGLDASGLNVVESALKHGVELTGINIMAMCWGDNFLPADGSPADMGALAIQAAEATFLQLKALFQKYNIEKTDAEIYAMLGVTPMIGKNYSDKKIFTVEDAQELADWAAEHDIGLLSMWSINRDQYNGTDLVKGSGIEQEPYDFSTEFIKYEDDGGGTSGNKSPDAKGDSATTEQDKAVTIDVLANDSDPDGDTISITKVTTPGNGTAVLSSGKITYTPKSGYFGTDTFVYTISDGKGGTDSATVSVTVNHSSSSAVDFKVASDWGSGFTGEITVTNTENFATTGWTVEFDFPYNLTSIWNAKIISHSGNHYVIGNVTWNGKLAVGAKTSFGFVASPGNVSNDPTNYVFHGIGSGTQNHNPVAQNDSATTDQDQAVSINVLANDSDSDGDTVSIASVGTPANGIASVSSGRVVYVPKSGFSGTDSFTYTISDGKGGTATATVSVTVKAVSVNHDPVAQNDSVTTDQDKAVTINVLANDSDPDGDTISIASVGTPANGTAAISSGKIVYTPKAGFSGTDSFTYTISDGKGGTATATVSVTVKAVSVNHDPVAQNDSVTTDQDKAVTINVLANDSDPDGDTISIASVGTPANGTAAISSGKIIYTPKAGFSGTDSFTYTISDGKGGTATATVSVTVKAVSVNHDPVAQNDSVTTDQDKALTINVLANDSDPDGDTISITGVTTPANGTAAISSGKIIYTPKAGFSGTDSFTYTISDGKGGTATATVSVTVKSTTSSTVDFKVSTDWGSGFTGQIIVTNTEDFATTGWTVEFDFPYNITSIWNAKVVSHSGNHYVIGNASWNGKLAVGAKTSFGFNGSPGNVSSDPANYVFHGIGSGTQNHNPVAQNDSAVTDQDKAVTIAVLANDSDPDGDTISISGVATPSNGTAAISSGKVVYTPKAGFSGTDSFTYTISDGKGGSATATVGVTVKAPSVNRPPVARNDSASTTQETAVTVNVLANDSDPDGDAVSIDFVGGPAHGLAVMNGQTIVYTPEAGFTGSDSFSYRIADGKGGTATAQVSITVNPQGSGGGKKVVGYYTNWAMYRTPSFKPLNIDGSKITHINYAFAKQDQSGKISLTDSWADVEYRDDWNTQRPYWGNFYQLKQLKEKYPHLKVLISIGGWSLSDKFSAMAADPQARANFVQNCIQFCETYDCFDGIDLDWEYPCFAEHGGKPEDKENFTLLLKELYTALKAHSPELLLSIAAPCGPDHYAQLELDKIAQYVDWINLMSYDFHGPWGDAETNHNAPLYAAAKGDARFNVDTAVQYYLGKGVPSEKLLMGIPLYGRSYAKAASTADGLYSSYSGAGSGTTAEAGVRFFSDIKQNLLNTYTRYWDDKCQVPYLYNKDASSAQYQEFISYDDEQAITNKGKYVKNNNLGGIMLWELGMDTENGDALNAVNEGLSGTETLVAATAAATTETTAEEPKAATVTVARSAQPDTASAEPKGPAPDLIAKARLKNSSDILLTVPGSKADTKWTVANQGGATAGKSTIRVYLSRDDKYGEKDYELASKAVGKIKAGKKRNLRMKFTIPDKLPDGDYYLVAVADADLKVKESVETNNAGVIKLRAAHPDLAVRPIDPDEKSGSYSMTPGLTNRISDRAVGIDRSSIKGTAKNMLTKAGARYEVEPGKSLSFSCEIGNRGRAPATSFRVTCYLSKNRTLDLSDTALGAGKLRKLVFGEVRRKKLKVTIPANTTYGRWYLLVKVDSRQELPESDETNNTTVIPITVTRGAKRL